MIVGVVGSGVADETTDAIAYAVGRGIAGGGHVLVCGGRGGVMREACRGARDGGGTTIGILPGVDRTEANEFVDIAIVTGLGEARNALVARTADVLIAVGGAYGTLSEIAFALVFGTPVVGVATWDLRDGRGEEPPVVRVETAADAVATAEALAADRA